MTALMTTRMASMLEARSGEVSLEAVDSKSFSSSWYLVSRCMGLSR